MKLHKLNDNALSETIELISRLQIEIEHFSHVSDFLPKGIINSINSFSDKLDQEFASREQCDCKLCNI